MIARLYRNRFAETRRRRRGDRRRRRRLSRALQRPTLDALGPVGGEVLLLTELQVREDAWTLFGFGSAGERDWFRALTSGPGRRRPGRAGDPVRARRPTSSPRAVAQDDKAMIGRANGVGPKLAARIANELQDKLGARRPRRRRRRAPRGGAAADALSALPTSASSRPKPAPRSTPRRTSSGPDAPRRAGAAGAEEGGEIG